MSFSEIARTHGAYPFPQDSFHGRTDRTTCGLYPVGPSLVAVLPGTRRVSARQGWAGEKSSLFDHPVGVFSSYPKRTVFPPLLEPGDVHPTRDGFHRIRHHLASPPEGIVRRSHDQILYHLHIAAFHHFRIDDDTDELHGAICGGGATATASCPSHGLRRCLFLHLRHLCLHRLRLLQNVSHIPQRVLHSSTSFLLDTGLTSASSAANISRACLTIGCARACSKRTSRCSLSFAALSCAIVGPEGSDAVNSTIRIRTFCPLSRPHIAVSTAILSGFSIIPRAAISCLANPIVTT